MHEINDISLVGVEHPELGVGYDLWVGGGLSTAPRLAERLGVFVAPERAAEPFGQPRCRREPTADPEVVADAGLGVLAPRRTRRR